MVGFKNPSGHVGRQRGERAKENFFTWSFSAVTPHDNLDEGYGFVSRTKPQRRLESTLPECYSRPYPFQVLTKYKVIPRIKKMKNGKPDIFFLL